MAAMAERGSCSVCAESLTRASGSPACCMTWRLGCGRYHLSLFYTEKEIGMAYSWITAGTALSQVLPMALASCCHHAVIRHACLRP